MSTNNNRTAETTREQQLLALIRESNDPAKLLTVALDAIIEMLQQPEPCE